MLATKTSIVLHAGALQERHEMMYFNQCGDTTVMLIVLCSFDELLDYWTTATELYNSFSIHEYV